MKAKEEEAHRWLTLRAACQILAVNQATLRRWADRSLVHTYRTPGGHRRFLSSDLHALMDRTGRPAQEHGLERLDDVALRGIRRRLRAEGSADMPWHTAMSEETRNRMRLFGQRLLTLATEYLSHPRRRGEILAEASMVGGEYAREVSLRGLTLSQAVEAFCFFRNSLLESVRKGLRTAGVGGGDRGQQEGQVLQLADEVLLAMTRAIDEAHKEPQAVDK